MFNTFYACSIINMHWFFWKNQCSIYLCLLSMFREHTMGLPKNHINIHLILLTNLRGREYYYHYFIVKLGQKCVIWWKDRANKLMGQNFSTGKKAGLLTPSQCWKSSFKLLRNRVDYYCSGRKNVGLEANSARVMPLIYVFINIYSKVIQH